jgi:hypothetical protein
VFRENLDRYPGSDTVLVVGTGLGSDAASIGASTAPPVGWAALACADLGKVMTAPPAAAAPWRSGFPHRSRPASQLSPAARNAKRLQANGTKPGRSGDLGALAACTVRAALLVAGVGRLASPSSVDSRGRPPRATLHAERGEPPYVVDQMDR